MRNVANGGEERLSSWLSGLFRRVLDLAGRHGDPRELLQEMLREPERHGLEGLSAQERVLLCNVLAFAAKRVEHVMVPRADIAAVPVETPLSGVVAAMRESGHSRLLVYRHDLDDVVGMVHVRDVLEYWERPEAFVLERVVREVPAVPPSMRALDLLVRMRESGQHLALVVDEYGGTDGIVTLHDLVSEIVGEIHEEREEDERLVEVPEDGTLLADARIELDELEALLDARLLEGEKREEVDTLGGLLVTLVDRIPVTGETIRHAGFVFEVLDADPRRVKRVRIRRDDRPAAREQVSPDGGEATAG